MSRFAFFLSIKSVSRTKLVSPGDRQGAHDTSRLIIILVKIQKTTQSSRKKNPNNCLLKTNVFFITKIIILSLLKPYLLERSIELH